MQVTSHHYVVGLMILIKNSSTGIKQSAKVGRSHILDDSYPSLHATPSVYSDSTICIWSARAHYFAEYRYNDQPTIQSWKKYKANI